MKTVTRLLMLMFALGLIAGCAPKPVKTIENLKAAYDGESTASAKYAAFAEKAKAEGFDTVAIMFQATSKAESIHAANHLKVLEKLGEKIAGPQIGIFTVMSTAENLADAIKGETYELETMYPDFISTAKAKAEGFDTVAIMFQATSKAESIHAANHLKVLEKLGEKIAGPQIGIFTVMSTAENLADAIKGETYELETMYPDFISTAKAEKSKDAVKSFTWALDTEKKHQAFYKTTLAVVTTGDEKGLAAKWFVCPVCGNTYNNLSALPAKCDFCMTPKEKFIEV